MAPHFVFVESNTTGTGAIAVERLLGQRAKVTFLARRPGMYPFLAAGALPDGRLAVRIVDTNAVEAVVREIGGLQRTAAVDAVLTFSEFYVGIVAEAARRLGFPYLAPAAARICRDKFATREALRGAGLATPAWWRLASLDEARAAAAQVVYPCVVKPPADSSSKGVRLVRDGRELLAHFAVLHGRRRNDRGQTLGGEVLVESLLTGPEVSVETVTLAGGGTAVVGITAKHLSPPPLFVEVGHDFPAALEPAVADRIAAEVRAALAAVGFDFGPAHTEVRLTAGGPVVVEINPRLAGGMIPELIRYAFGIDLLGAVLDQLRGQAPALRSTRRHWSSIRFLLADRSGRLAGARGLETARRLPGVREVSLLKPEGAALRPAEEAADRVGFVIASGRSRRRVLAAVARAQRQIRLEIAAGACRGSGAGPH
jgi:biotin carboxylase